MTSDWWSHRAPDEEQVMPHYGWRVEARRPLAPLPPSRTWRSRRTAKPAGDRDRPTVARRRRRTATADCYRARAPRPRRAPTRGGKTASAERCSGTHVTIPFFAGVQGITCGAGVSPAKCSRDGRTTKLQTHPWTAAYCAPTADSRTQQSANCVRTGAAGGRPAEARRLSSEALSLAGSALSSSAAAAHLVQHSLANLNCPQQSGGLFGAQFEVDILTLPAGQGVGFAEALHRGDQRAEIGLLGLPPRSSAREARITAALPIGTS